MSKNAAIYIRTSSEHQAEKASPEEQERDCRALAEVQELEVVKVYRDTEKYRVKTRQVDPSGTRTDRPGLLALLEDAAAGQFDTILAWKEDRLYRGLRAMLLVLDAITEHKLSVILVKETFDPRMAPVKAWVAQMELDNIKERMTMGVKARLRAGKANTGQDRYGYERIGEAIVVKEDEAQWVRQIFAWYNQRVSLQEIRRRLIEADAPQKGSSVPRKIVWAISSIQGILQSAYQYAHGIKIQTRAGESFTIPVEPIITEETYQTFLVVRESNKTYPARNLKRDYLAAGLLYCPCGRRWGARTASAKKDGRERAKPTAVYFCTEKHREMRHRSCPKTIGSKKADDYLWAKVVEALSDPWLLIEGARHHIGELQQRALTVTSEREQIQQRLEELGIERQWVITQARKGKITSDDMQMQLGSLSMEEAYHRRELANINSVFEVADFADWESSATNYLQNLWYGVMSLNEDPQSDEEREEIFQLKRRVVMGLVERIEIGEGRRMLVVFKLDVLSLLGVGSDSTPTNPLSGGLSNQNRSDGIYSRRRSSLLRRRCAACA